MAHTLLVSGALKFGSSNTGKKVIGAIFGFIATIIILLICVIGGLISIFTNSGKISNDFDVKDTSIYKELRNIYDDYAVGIKEEIHNLAINYRDSNMDYDLVEVFNPETQKKELVKQWYCTAQISEDFQYINSAYTLAYLSIVNQNDYLSDKANIKISENQVVDFWNTIGGIKVNEGGTNEEPTYFIHNQVMKPEEIAEHYFISSALQKQYLESVYLISQFVGIENFEDDIYAVANKLNIPLYYQYELPWGNNAYGNGNIAKNGCAPTCIAMVFTHLKGYRITPIDIVEFTKNKYYVSGAGSSWQIFSACANEWDIECTYIGTAQRAIIDAMEAGKPVILSMGPGIFTRSGHFIVLTGITENGKVTVNDPNDSANKDFVNKEFNLSQILGEAKGGWRFE